MKLLGPVVVVVVAALAAFGTVTVGGPAVLLVIGVLGLLLGMFIGLRHPTWLLWGLAIAAGLFPAGYLPGVHLPMVFSFTMGVLVATIVHPRRVIHLSTMERMIVLLVAVSFVSLIITVSNLADVLEFIKWAAASLLIVALLRLPRPQLARFGQVYVVATTVSALLAFVILVGDSSGRILGALSILGYGAAADLTTFAVYSGGTETVRLTGTFLEPNSAGIGILVALLMCAVLFRGKWRLAMGAVLLVALLLTLSRSAIFALIGAVVLMLLFQSMPVRRRAAIVGTFVAAFLGALSVPQIRSRILSSFGSQDTGSSSRLDAIKEFPSQMSGRWFFGRGWGLPEFKNGDLAFTTNFVANAPLLSVYRGGIFVALVFVAAMLYGCYLAYTCMRSTDWELGLFGGGFIAFFFVTMQLDIGTIIIPASIVGLSLFIVFVVYASELAAEGQTAVAPGAPTTEREIAPIRD